MKKNTILSLILAFLLLTMLLVTGCEDKESTNVEEIVELDGVDVTLIDNWDLWEIQGMSAASANAHVVHKTRNISRDGEGYPVLVEELYANIEPHKIVLDGITYDSAADDIQSVHMENNQLWVVDNDENSTYYYDYFYNQSSGALWLHEETTEDTIWAVDPTVTDTVFVGPDSTAYIVDIQEYTLLFRYEQGPALELTQPENNWIVPDPDNPEIDDLTPQFEWNQFIGEDEEYTFQLRKDEDFDAPDGFVYNEVIDGETSFTVPTELDNFDTYFWRVKADVSDWSNVWTFITEEVVLLTSPTNNSFLGLKPTMVWETLNGASEYILQYSHDINFVTGVEEIYTTDTQYTPTSNLEANTEYFWRVRGDNSVSNGEVHWSDIWSFTTDQRVNMSVASPSDEETEVVVPVEFSWGALQNTAGYHLQVATDSLFADTDIVIDEEDLVDNSYIETGVLAVNEEYFWRVMSDVAFDWGDTLSFITNTKVLLNTPENEADDQNLLIEFKWERFNSNSTTYVVQVADEDTFTNPVVDSYIYYDGDQIMCDTASRIEENDDDDLIEFIAELSNDFAPNTMYYWRVQRDSLDWSDVWNFTTGDLLDAIELSEPADEALNVELLPKLKWASDPGATYYRFLVSLDENLADTLWINRVVDANNYTLDKLEDEMLLVGTTYYWKVRSERTAWSEPWSFTVRSGIPFDIMVAGDEDGFNYAATPNKNDLSWECLDGEHDGYLIERSIGVGNEDWVLIDSLGATTYTFADMGLEENTVYNYRMRTHYPLGYSGYSDVISVTTKSFNISNMPQMVTLQAGTFSMGSNSGDDDEMPIHDVTLTNDIQFGKYEVTNLEFCELLNWALGKGYIKGIDNYGGNANHAAGAYNLEDILNEDQTDISFSGTSHMFKVAENRDNFPAVGVTYFGGANYCNWLGAVENTNLLYSGSSSLDCTVYGTAGFRLPTEAEWEFAARNRGNSNFMYSGSDDIDAVAWYIGNANDDTHQVGTKAANELLIFDMSGNAWEWCNDLYDAYPANAISDPIGPGGSVGSNDTVVIRGGSWEYDAPYLRNTNRSYALVNLSSKVNTQVGFRIVQVP